MPIPACSCGNLRGFKLRYEHCKGWGVSIRTPERNINWTYGLGVPRPASSAATYVTLLFVAFIVFVFLPTHLLLQAFYGSQP